MKSGAFLLAILMLLISCVSAEPSSNWAQSALPLLQQIADSGNQQAQFELGLRYEEGRGIPKNIDKAKALYKLAAAPNAKSRWVYAPPSIVGQRGTMIQVSGPVEPGVAAAAQRLKYLENTYIESKR